MENYRKELRGLRTGKRPPQRSGEYWTEDEVQKLTTMFEEGIGISAIAVELDRTEVAIYQQLEKKGFLANQCKPRNRKKLERIVQDCLCPFCGNKSCSNCGKDCSHAGNIR